MICAGCGQLDAAVLETRRLYGGSVIRRKRACTCGAKFSTYEIEGGIWGTVRKWAVKSHLVSMTKKQALRSRNTEIVARLKRGDKGRDVALEFGLSGEMVSYLRKQAGLPPARAAKAKRSWFYL